jgi:4-amino-4-deoxy-L-arabinose transferase-like glycosyltransferase
MPYTRVIFRGAEIGVREHACARPISRGFRVGLAGALLFCLALLPRAQSLDQYVTVDEDRTIGRTGNFVEGLATGRWQRTYQIGYPEVTAMWVATLALRPSWAREFAGSVSFDGRVHRTREVVERPGFMAALARARLGAAVLHSLLLAIIGLLIWRLSTPAAGLLGGAVLALDPFQVAHGQLLHVDGLLADLMAVSALAGLVYWWARGGLGYLVLAGVAGGLALLSKTPGVYLFAYGAAVAALAWWTGRCGRRAALAGWAGYAGLVALTYWGLWPAMWVAPVETVGRVIDWTRQLGAQPHPGGSFFLGQHVEDPGPAYYPVAVGYRLGPGVVTGLVALGLGWRGLPAKWRAVALLLAVYALGFGVMMTLGPKKFDRYLLPAFPALGALAGLGFWGGGRWLGARLGRPVLGGVVVGLLGLGLQAWGLATVHPYYLAYYNPLLGGGTAASRAILVGWGEGLDQVARALNQQPDAPSRTVAVLYPQALGAQFVGQAVRLESYDVADFAVLYVGADQRHLTPPPLAAALADQSPELEVYLNGVRYAQLFRLPATEFAGGILLDRVDLVAPTVARGDWATLDVRWATRAPSAEGFRSRLALLHADGRVAAESVGPLHAQPLPGHLLQDQHRFRVPNRPGRYTVALSLQSEPDGGMLPVVRRPPGLEESVTRLIFRSLRVRVQ